MGQYRFLTVPKSGFTKKCIERMDDKGIMHWDLRDIERMIENAKTENTLRNV